MATSGTTTDTCTTTEAEASITLADAEKIVVPTAEVPSIVTSTSKSVVTFVSPSFFIVTLNTTVDPIPAPVGPDMELVVRSAAASSLLMNTPKNIDIGQIYEKGYKNKPDRTKLFPWNKDVDCLLNMKDDEVVNFLNKYFYEYKNKYTMYIKKD